ncbi:hypothetical protein K7432_013930, partial [Basidiobolus ranarum]
MSNVDMIASPNYVIRLYNGDTDGLPVPVRSEISHLSLLQENPWGNIHGFERAENRK